MGTPGFGGVGFDSEPQIDESVAVLPRMAGRQSPLPTGPPLNLILAKLWDCETVIHTHLMKNITLAIDEDTYRRARIAAARRDASVSSLVKQYLQTLAATESAPARPAHELETLLNEIASRHPGFTCGENLSREALHENRR